MEEQVDSTTTKDPQDHRIICDLTADRSSRMNSEVYRDISSTQIQANAEKLTRQLFTVQMDKEPKSQRQPKISQGKEMG